MYSHHQIGFHLFGRNTRANTIKTKIADFVNFSKFWVDNNSEKGVFVCIVMRIVLIISDLINCMGNARYLCYFFHCQKSN